ncbi:hypothetical protein HTZ85_08730 [Escherichia coli]|nr:hypothetical protein [Escherichia coli]
MIFARSCRQALILNVMNKLIELRRAKMLALSLLLIAAATFVVTLFFAAQFLGERREGDC